MSARTVNILITRDPNIVRTYFGLNTQFLSKSVTFSNLEQSVKDSSKSLLYSTDKGKNIIQLQHSVTTGDEDTNVPKGVIVVDFIDPDGTFEADFVKFNVTDLFNDYAKERVQSLKPEQTERFRDYIANTVVSASLNQNFYVAYGTTDDLSTWAGPFLCQFSDAKVRYFDDSPRKLTLFFIPVRSPFSCSIGIDGENLPLSLYRSNYFVSVTEKIKAIDATEVDYSKIIYGLFEKYINSIYAGKCHTIVLLPEVKSYFMNQIRAAIKKNLTNTATPLNKRAVGPSKTIFVGPLLKTPPEVVKELRARELNIYDRDALAAQKSAVAEILEEFGIQLALNNVGIDADIQNLVAGVKEQRTEYLWKTPLNEFEAILKTALTDDFWRDYYAPIKNLRDLLGRFSFETVFFEETNTKILKIWKDSGIIPDDTKPVVILGDLNLVIGFLYGEYEGELNFVPSLPVGFIKNARGVRSTTLFGAQTNETIVPTEFVYDREDEANTQQKKLIYGPKFYLRQEDLNKFKSAGLQYKMKAFVNKNYVYQYGELQKTGIRSVDTKLDNVIAAINKTKYSIPIFRFNVPNPNVIKLDLNSKNSYSVILYSTIRKLIYDYAIKVTQPISNNDEVTKRGSSIAAYHAIELANKIITTGDSSNLQEQAKKIILSLPDSATTLKKKSVEEQSRELAALIASLVEANKDKPGPILELSTWDGSELVGVRKMVSDLMRQMQTIKVRTLPMFQLSNTTDTLGKVCYLLANAVTTYGHTDTIMSDVLSNEYRIKEFNHIINSDDCYSEFVLMVDPNTLMTNKTMGSE